MRLALSQVAHPDSFAAGLDAVIQTIRAAAEADAAIVCLPECCLKGMRGTDFPVEAITGAEHDLGLARASEAARAYGIAVILPTERPWKQAWQNGAYVIDADGSVQGYQTKNQIPLEEEPFFEPGTTRKLFEVGGVTFGVVICHEGWRYPETVRWAAARGASLVFHPHFSGYPEGFTIPEDSYYEHAKLCRAGENSIWLASVNFALPVQDCTTSIIDPDARPIAAAPLNQPSLLVADIDPSKATGLLAKRYAPNRYADDQAPS